MAIFAYNIKNYGVPNMVEITNIGGKPLRIVDHWMKEPIILKAQESVKVPSSCSTCIDTLEEDEEVG